MSIWALCTATILVTSGVSHNKWQLLAGRILNYIYIGMELSSVPVYQSEVVPGPIRGLAVGSYQFSLGIGGLIVNSICRGTSEIGDDRSWYVLLQTSVTFPRLNNLFMPCVATNSHQPTFTSSLQDDTIRSILCYSIFCC